TAGNIPATETWSRWWSYEGISGPNYWGKTNPDWKLCKHGKQQSPINIEPSRLLFDPNLKHLKLDSVTVNGILSRTNQDITLDIRPEGSNLINISLGPLSYTYTVAEIKFHLANNDTAGSEHRVSGRSFPAEMHIIAYNSELYKNLTEATKGVKGLTIIAVFMELGKEHNKYFYCISQELHRLQHRDNKAQVRDLSMDHLLPKTTEYVTYDGSLTQPGCYETVTWILLNKPLRISKEQLSALRVLYNGRDNDPAWLLESNARPLMPLNHRVVRTNINSQKRSRLCTMERDMFYQVNGRYLKT
ncbi:carbonic anhydrase-like protein 1, partial [Biomphalaria pfeifferi]